MIRVKKSRRVPKSLQRGDAYSSSDVFKQLIADQYGKCYICEMQHPGHLQVDHFRSRSRYPELVNRWSNLLCSCGYCNRKKGSGFDGMLNPLRRDIDEEIEQSIDFKNDKAVFKAVRETKAHLVTVELLERVYNGTHKLRRINEQMFYEHAMSKVNDFQQLIMCWLEAPEDSELRESYANAIRSELLPQSELLAFKRQILRLNPKLSIFLPNNK